MNKGDLVEAVAKDLSESKAAAERAVNAVLENVKKEGVADYQIKSVPNLKIAEYLKRNGFTEDKI